MSKVREYMILKGIMPPLPKRGHDRTSCRHAERTGRQWHSGRPCLGEEIICRHPIGGGLRLPSGRCRPSRCAMFEDGGEECQSRSSTT